MERFKHHFLNRPAMQRKLIKHRDGDDSIWTACLPEGEGAMLIGNFNTDGKYTVKIASLDEFGRITQKIRRDMDCSCEANTIFRHKGGFIIGGNACGVATAQGGKGWKAYALVMDEDWNPVVERTYELGNNDAIYGIERSGDGFIFIGETEKEGMSYVFLMKTDELLNPMETRYLVPYKNVLVGGIEKDIIAYSFLSGGKWHGLIMKLGENMDEREIIAEIDGLQIYSMNFEGEIFISGEKDGKAYVAEIFSDGEIVELLMDNGVITKIRSYGDRVIAVGDFEAMPYFAIMDREFNIIDEHFETEENGWLEDVCAMGERIIAVGYSMEDRRALTMIFENDF